MELSYPAARNLLAVCEYHYRLGILHACSAGDAELVRSIADRDDNHLSFQYLDGEVYHGKGRELKVWLDRLIGLCRQIYGDSLAEYLRGERSETMKRDICAIIDFHYRKGLIHGLRLRDKRKAKEYFDTVGRGNSHVHLFNNRKWDTVQYFDTVIKRITDLHLERQSASASTQLNRLANILRAHVIKELQRRKQWS